MSDGAIWIPGWDVPRPGWRRPLRPLAFGLALIGLAASVLIGSLTAFRADETERARVRLGQLSAALSGEIERIAHVPFILAGDQRIAAAARGLPPPGLNDRLAMVAARTGLEAIYVMDAAGLTVAASNHDEPGSFLGQRYDFRPYFLEAIAGRTGTFFGVGATTRRPGYFVAMPVPDASAPAGVVAAKLSLTAIERQWAADGEAVYVTDADGIVLLAADPAWRYRTLGPLGPERMAVARGSRQFAGASLLPFDAIARDGSPVPRVEGATLHVAGGNLPNGWVLHYLADDGAARVKAWLAAGATLGIATLLLLVRQHRRTTRVRAALGSAVAREGELRRMNERLAVEIEERRLAEHHLERTQEELRRASRLAVLGQLAASVSHELSQPIAAMRNHLMADEIHRARAGAAAGPPTGGRSAARMAGLVDRMEAITRQLKFFGKPGDSMVTAIDLRDVVPEALSLVGPNAEAAAVELATDLPPGPVAVRGNRLRVEQVLVNLARNGIDAMEEGGGGRLSVSCGREGEWAVLSVADEGPGLADRTIDELTEPFATTRASGKGMGLGLAISREIVREHGGTLLARNGPAGGAVFEVRLPHAGAGAA